MKKILIIDDDLTFQLTIGTKLKNCGYEVHTAMDGEVGLEQALKVHPDLILLDIRMPKLDGLSMLKKLQEDKEAGKQIPIFITSNLSGLEDISEGVSLGIKGYIVKSEESLDTIVTAVNTALGQKSEEEAG